MKGENTRRTAEPKTVGESAKFPNCGERPEYRAATRPWEEVVTADPKKVLKSELTLDQGNVDRQREPGERVGRG